MAFAWQQYCGLMWQRLIGCCVSHGMGLNLLQVWGQHLVSGMFRVGHKLNLPLVGLGVCHAGALYEH